MRPAPARLAPVLVLLALVAAVIAPPATAAKPRHFIAKHVERPIVPVLAEVGGTSARQRQREARVRVYALSKAGKRLVGRGRTGSRGVALVVLRTKRTPGLMRVVVSGGRTMGKRFRGTMSATVRHAGRHAVYVSPASTLVTRDQLAHPRRKLARSEALVRRSLGLPRFFDFATDNTLFATKAFMRKARRAGGFDRYLTRLSRRVGRKPAPRRAAASAGSGTCWGTAAQTTAGFAKFLGFQGTIPNAPALPSGCTVKVGSGSRAGSAQVGEVAGVISAVIGVANFAYKVFSGQSTQSTLQAIQTQLDEIQSTLTTIEAQLGGLQTQLAAVNSNVTNGNITALVGDALPTITAIKTAGRDVNALVGAAYQVVCDPTDGCTSVQGTKSFGGAIDTICDDGSAACNRFYTYLYFTTRTLDDAEPLQAIENLGGYSLGSASGGGPGGAGIVQYSLQEQVGDGQFFQTGDAQQARLQWAYYTLYSTWAQTTYAIALSMGVGQPLPNSKSAHPPLLTPRTVVQLVNQLNAPISTMYGAFPNMPDAAVIDTNTGSADGDTPYLISQQVGGMSSSGLYVSNPAFTVSQSNVDAGTIAFTNGSGFMSTIQTSGDAPVVITPAAADGDTWQLLPATGTKTPPAPSVTTSYFDDFTVAGATATTALPEWNSSSQAVDVSQGGLTGPLADLYSASAPANGQTAGQWMTSESGIQSGLLMPQNTGYGNTQEVAGFAGVVPYYAQSGTDSNDPGLGFTSCTPANDTQCLLPTWQSVAIDPYSQVKSGSTYNSGSTDLNTGLFDFNNGQVIANQQGHDQNSAPGFTSASLPSNAGAWLNQYPNWSNAQTLRGVNFYGFLDALDGVSQGGLQNAAYSGYGRPVLFARQQTANDCFFWTGATGSNPAGGTGCLTVRTTSEDVLG